MLLLVSIMVSQQPNEHEGSSFIGGRLTQAMGHLGQAAFVDWNSYGEAAHQWMFVLVDIKFAFVYVTMFLLPVDRCIHAHVC